MSNQFCYSRFGGILKDEPNLWGPLYNGGSNIGLNSVRNYCLAYNIFISGTIDSQKTAAQVLNDLCEITNCAPCWDGAGLDFIPYCEVSNFFNGASYVAPTSSGPVARLTSKDFISKQKGDPPVVMTRTRPKDTQNINSIKIQYRDRLHQYNPNSVTISDTLDITQQGDMQSSTKTYDWIHDSNTAIYVGWALLRRELTCKRKTYTWKLGPNWGALLTLMDLVELAPDNDPSFPEIVPVRITKISEDKDFTVDYEAEAFMYGASSPVPPTSIGGAVPGGGGQNNP